MGSMVFAPGVFTDAGWLAKFVAVVITYAARRRIRFTVSTSFLVVHCVGFMLHLVRSLKFFQIDFQEDVPSFQSAFDEFNGRGIVLRFDVCYLNQDKFEVRDKASEALLRGLVQGSGELS